MTNAEYWSSKIARNVDRDRETDTLLRNAGWLSMRFWEHDDPDRSAVTIAKAVQRRKNQRQPSPSPSRPARAGG